MSTFDVVLTFLCFFNADWVAYIFLVGLDFYFLGDSWFVIEMFIVFLVEGNSLNLGEAIGEISPNGNFF